MKTLQKFGGFSALYMAAAHLIGIVIFLVILDYLSITGPVIDQSTLHGLLKKVRDLGMPLSSVSPVESGQADVPHV